MVNNKTKSTEVHSLLAKINHELRGPIHGISGLANYLEKNWNTLDDNTKKSCVSDILKSGNLLQDLVEKLFQLSSLKDKNIIYSPTKINIIELAEKTIENTKLFIIDKNVVNIYLSHKEEKIYSMIDEFWINQLLYNLINNALKHSCAKNIKIEINSRKSDILVSVIDDGVGLPKDELDIVFEPFKQGSMIASTEKGSGLGLSICREIIEAHKGEITAKNNKDSGLTISFNIPKYANTL